MAAFAAGGADVLVATTVIEVGIDVPNATVMLVEDAERYGISPAAPAARPRRARRARRRCACSSGPRDSRAPAGARRARRRLRAGRDRPRAARRGRADRHAPVRASRASASRGCPRTRELLERAHARADRAAARRPRARARPSTRCWPTALARGVEARARARHEGRRRALRRPALRAPRGARRRARPPTACARRCSRCSARWTARACSTCSPARARWGSRRSRAARSAPPSSSVDARAAAVRANLEALGLGADEAAVRRRARGAPRRIAARPTHTIWSSSTRRTATRRRLGPELSRGLAARCSARPRGS